MGSSYHEGITVEEVNSFLANGKFVNLNDGGYVDKDKYDKAVAAKDKAEQSLSEYKENTKDYEDLKKFKTETIEKAENSKKVEFLKAQGCKHQLYP